jgi:hypothetical protein
LPKPEAGDRGFAQRLSPLIAAAGVVAVPALLVRHQARLQLSNAEVIYLLHVLSHRWDGTHWPWVAVSAIAEGAGAHTGVVRRWKASLEAKGFLVCKPRVVPGVGRRADEHDLSRLFAALEALALEEETQKALDKARSDLPDAQFHRGLATTPQLSTGRTGRKMRARTNENAGARPGENAGSARTKSRGTAPAKTPGELEPGQEERLNRTRRKNSAQESGQRAGAPRRPEEKDVVKNDALSIDDEDPPPGYFDEGIASYITEWGAELLDNDPQRSLDRAHRLWWNSKLERGRFHNAMKAAKHVTVARMARGQVTGRPMAYFFGVLKFAAMDECVKAGMPMPRGWRLRPPDEEQASWEEERVG